MASKKEPSEKPAAKAKAKPKAKTPAKKTTSTRRKAPEVTEAMIAERAYHIALSGEGGSDEENWLRAEAELRGA